MGRIIQSIVRFLNEVCVQRLCGLRREKVSLGGQGELKAMEFLKENGYQIVEQNYQLTCGEIDLIAIKDELIVFVEVKTLQKITRKPQDAVTKSKQRKIISTARLFLIKNGLTKNPHRFDIVAIRWPMGQDPRIEHFPNAFSP